MANEESTDSPETDKSWFSDCSSVEEKETDSNDQDSPSYRPEFLPGAEVTESDRHASDCEQASVTKRISSSRKIQRSWRRWRLQQLSVRAAFDATEPSPTPSDDSRTQSIRSVQQDHDILTTGIYMQKVRSASKKCFAASISTDASSRVCSLGS